MVWRGGWKDRRGKGSAAAFAGVSVKQWADTCQMLLEGSTKGRFGHRLGFPQSRFSSGGA